MTDGGDSTADGLDPRVRASMLAAFARAADMGIPAPVEAQPPPEPGRVERAQWEPRRPDTRLVNSTIRLPSGETALALVEHHDGAGVTVQLDDQVGMRLSQGVELGKYFRRLGLGRVRADLSVPLEPRDDRLWITEPNADARLHLASSEGVAVVTLGELSYSSRRMLTFFGLGLIICVGGHLLPDSHQRQLIHERDKGTVWGGLVSEGNR